MKKIISGCLIFLMIALTTISLYAEEVEINDTFSEQDIEWAKKHKKVIYLSEGLFYTGLGMLILSGAGEATSDQWRDIGGNCLVAYGVINIIKSGRSSISNEYLEKHVKYKEKGERFNAIVYSSLGLLLLLTKDSQKDEIVNNSFYDCGSILMITGGILLFLDIRKSSVSTEEKSYNNSTKLDFVLHPMFISLSFNKTF